MLSCWRCTNFGTCLRKYIGKFCKVVGVTRVIDLFNIFKFLCNELVNSVVPCIFNFEVHTTLFINTLLVYFWFGGWLWLVVVSHGGGGCFWRWLWPFLLSFRLFGRKFATRKCTFMLWWSLLVGWLHWAPLNLRSSLRGRMMWSFWHACLVLGWIHAAKWNETCWLCHLLFSHESNICKIVVTSQAGTARAQQVPTVSQRSWLDFLEGIQTDRQALLQCMTSLAQLQLGQVLWWTLQHQSSHNNNDLSMDFLF